MSFALPKRLKDSLATRPEIQITHTRGGRQSLTPVDILLLHPVGLINPRGLCVSGWIRQRNALTGKAWKDDAQGLNKDRTLYQPEKKVDITQHHHWYFAGKPVVASRNIGSCCFQGSLAASRNLVANKECHLKLKSLVILVTFYR